MALVAGVSLLIGAFVALFWQQRRQTLEVAARTRTLELAHSQQQSAQALRELELQHQATQAREQLEALRANLEQLQQRSELRETERNEARQALAAAHEQLKQLSELRAQFVEREAIVVQLRQEQAELQTRLDAERKSFHEQLQLLQQARTELTREFENVANKIFDTKQQQFSINSKNLLETTIDPLKSQLTEFRRKVEEVYDKENAERNRLAGQVQELQKQAQKIGEDAVNLAQALKGNSKSQGNWGEVVLERLLEQSGLHKGREYETQVSFTAEDGTRRMPDVIVRLPEGKDIVIDAKVSLLDYERYCNSEAVDERERHLQAHVASVRSHIKNLSVKDYEKLEGVRALDFVFIFVPIEAAFMLALQHEPELYREAYDRHIILASPTTLLAILRTVENIWRYEKQNKNAERIAQQAGSLHDQFVLLLEALKGIGSHIDKTREAYDLAYKRLGSGRGNLLKRVDDLRKLGAKTKKTLGVEQFDDLDDSELLPEPGDVEPADGLPPARE